MARKDNFIKFVKDVVENVEGLEEHEYFDEAMEYLEKLSKPAAGEITEKALEVMFFMRDTMDECNNVFTATTIGDGLGRSGRGIPTTLKTPIYLGYVSKNDEKSPKEYGLTAAGIEYLNTVNTSPF